MPVAPTGAGAYSPYEGEDRRRIAGPVPSPFGKHYIGAAVLVVALTALFSSAPMVSPAAAEETLRLLQLLQMASFLIAVIVGGLALGRWYLTGDMPALWIGAAMLTYGVGRLAVAELAPMVAGPGSGMGWVEWLRPATQLVVVGLLIRAATVVPISARISGPRVAVVAVGGIAALGIALRFVPAAAALVDGTAGATGTPGASYGFGVMPATFIALATAFTVQAKRRRRWLFAWLGLLCAALALGEVVRVVAPPPTAAGLLGLETLRLVGLLLALFGGVREILFTYRDSSVRLAQSEYTALTAQERIRAGQAEAEERAHEARSALAAIEGATRTLEHYRDRLPPETQAALSTAVTGEIRRLQRLVSIEQAADPIGEFDVRACLDPVIESERARGAVIEEAVPANLAARGRSGATAQVVQTLFDNARIYAPGTTLTVRVDVEERMAVIRVQDGGPGVPEDERETIFERGRRGRAAGPRPGTGIGLYVAAQLMNDQGGRLWVEDGPGGGASFALAVPLASGAQESVDRVDQAPQIVEERSLRSVDRGH